LIIGSQLYAQFPSQLENGFLASSTESILSYPEVLRRYAKEKVQISDELHSILSNKKNDGFYFDAEEIRGIYKKYAEKAKSNQ